MQSTARLSGQKKLEKVQTKRNFENTFYTDHINNVYASDVGGDEKWRRSANHSARRN